MTIAHIGGMPVEEWLMPIAAGGTGMVLALSAVVRRRVRQRPRAEGSVR
jgi:hypothetical protein